MGDVTIINKARIIRDLKIYGTVFFLTVSSYNVSGSLVYDNSDFNTTIKSEHNIDELNDYVLQGLCKVDDNYLLSAYDNNHGNSILYVLDEDFNNCSTKVLDTNSHVGGITYDPVNNNIWVTDTNGTISAYDKDDIMSSDETINSKYKNIYVGDELYSWLGSVSAAYITYYNNRLYVGNYNMAGLSVIKEYNLDDNGMIDTSSYNKYHVSQFVQGIAFYEKDDTTYLITSSSFSKYLNSRLQVYDFDTLEKIKTIDTNKMMEEILVDDDKLITLYEANAKVYKGNDNNKDLIVSDLNKILAK